MARGVWQVAFVVFFALTIGSVATEAHAQAQGQAYLQIEAHPDLATTEARVRAYARLVDDIRAFRLASGWYGIVAGPYAPAEAAARLNALSAEGLLPSDAYVEVRPIYVQQVFPAGEAPPATPQATGDATPEAEADAVQEAEVIEQPPLEESPAEARASEAALDRTQREALQIALQWFGFYTAGIDGAFGPGTRAGMQAWQIDRGFEATGVLTTRQRSQLLDEYRGELAALGMRVVTDRRAGIEMNMPMAMVEFGQYEFPFAQYEPINDSGVRILLISQEGTSRTLAGLYEIMQTLEIVPLQGERSRDGDSFLLTGQSATLRSHSIARLQDGQIKGFTLIWPPERDAQIARVLPMMEESFTPIPGVLDPGAVSEETLQGVDLVSGLEVRTPEIRRSGFFATADGTVMTTTEVVGGQCTRILIDDTYEAEVTFRDDAIGLAVLRPRTPLAPIRFADFAQSPPRVRAPVAVAGFPFDGALGTASLNLGELADLTGLDGDTRLRRLALDIEASEAGGPVLDASGAVIGMVLPEGQGGRTLPDGVSFALGAATLSGTLADQGLILPATAQGGDGAAAEPERQALGAQALARLGADLTVLVSCWN